MTMVGFLPVSARSMAPQIPTDDVKMARRLTTLLA
jgi:hypothetical protein